jgi:hypothetical protein
MDYDDNFDDDYGDYADEYDDFESEDEGLIEGQENHEEYDADSDEKDDSNRDIGDLSPLEFAFIAGGYEFFRDSSKENRLCSGSCKIKCLSCGCTFVGKIDDNCPECNSVDTEEIIP